MVSATFIFRPKTYDAEFHRLDALIDEANRRNPEFVGKDSWENTEQNLFCVVYYFKTMAGLVELKNIHEHRVAKKEYTKWYEGYHVVISEVLTSYGDGFIEHATPAVVY